MYEKIKRFYKLGLYTNAQVKVFVTKGIITSGQYEEITGEPYSSLWS